jgi:hypothetical protein
VCVCLLVVHVCLCLPMCVIVCAFVAVSAFEAVCFELFLFLKSSITCKISPPKPLFNNLSVLQLFAGFF